MLSTIGEGAAIVRWLWSLACAVCLLVAVFPRTTSEMAVSPGLLRSQMACSSNNSPPASATVRDRAGLAAMLDLASGLRKGLQPQKLPYSQLVTAFNQLDANATNLHTAFQSAIASAGVSLAHKALYSASPALILGFAVPCVFVLLWWVLPKMWRVDEGGGWEGEGVDDDFYHEQLDRTRNEQEKNMSFNAQVCAWVLAGAVVALVLVLVVFVGILLAGNQWVAEGVVSSSAAAQQVLPKLDELRMEAIHSINTTLMAEYEALKMGFQQEVRSQVVGFRVDMQGEEGPGDSLVTKVNKLTDRMRTTKTYLEHIIGNWTEIKAFERGAVSELHEAVSASVVQCGLLLQSNSSAASSPLHGLCKELEVYQPTLNSVVAGGVVQQLEIGYLPVVKQITSENSPWGSPTGWKTMYRNQVEQSMLQYLEDRFAERVAAVLAGLAAVVAEVSSAYRAVDLHLPRSAEMVAEYMGPRYLSSWEELRFGSFLILALFLLALFLVTLAFTARGLLCIFAMYRTGYDPGTARASTHSAAIMQKSMWVIMAILACLGVAIFVTLPVSSSLGAACGPSGNFSGATDRLLDSPGVWSGGYPLGSLLLGNSSATLTLKSMMSTCMGGGSMYRAFQLHCPLHQIQILDQEMVALVDAIRSFVPPLPSVLGPNVSAGLNASLGLPLPNKFSLLRDFYSSVFGNFSQSIQLLTNLTDNLMHTLGSLGTLRDSVSKVRELAEQCTREHTVMQSQLEAMGREAFQLYEDILGWSTHSKYLEREASIAGKVQTLFVTTYRETVAKELVGVVQKKIGRVQHSVWTNVMCSAGECREAASLYGEFAGAVCADVLDGLDLVWSGSCAVFLTLIPLAACSLLLSRRLSYPRSMQEENSFHLAGTAFGLAGSILWFTLAWMVDAWLLSTLKTSADFHSQLCPSTSSGCCVQCVWIFALLFLSVSVVVAVACYLYQGYLIHRTKKCRIVRTRNYWLRRYKAVHFYCRLWTLVLLDLPFLIFACVFMGSVHRLQLPAVLALGLALLGTTALVVTCVRERKDVRAHWLWLRKEVQLKSDWVRRLAATPTPPPQPPPHCNGLAPSQGSMDQYEMSSIEADGDIGPPLELGRSIPVLPPYTGHPFHTGLEREERPRSLTAASDSETDTYISGGTGQSHCSRPHRHPSSVAIMDELVDPNGSEMLQRKQNAAHYDNGGVEVVEPELCDSSTYTVVVSPASLTCPVPMTPHSTRSPSADEMYASDAYVSPVPSQDDGATSKARSRMMRRHSLSGDVFVDDKVGASSWTKSSRSLAGHDPSVLASHLSHPCRTSDEPVT